MGSYHLDIWQNSVFQDSLALVVVGQPRYRRAEFEKRRDIPVMGVRMVRKIHILHNI